MPLDLREDEKLTGGIKRKSKNMQDTAGETKKRKSAFFLSVTQI